MSQPRPESMPSSNPMPAKMEFSAPPASEPQAASIETLAPAQALELFVADPFAFVRQIVEDAAKSHLADLKEEAELKSALNAFRKKSAEFQRFEPFILQEVVTLLREDPDGGSASWEQLIEKGLDLFRQKFEATLQAKLAEGNLLESAKANPSPYMETAANRAIPTEPPNFTRKQIAGMSLPEFLKNEEAINEAMKNNRVR